MKVRYFFAKVFLLMMATSLALADDVEKGMPATPPSVKAVAGDYYCGDGTGYNVTIKLNENGKYSVEWHGCLGKYGDASGSWKLSDKQIMLTPKKETDMMKGHLKILDILKYKDDWIFVRSDDRDFYDKHGISRFSCFQKVKTEKAKQLPSRH